MDVRNQIEDKIKGWLGRGNKEDFNAEEAMNNRKFVEFLNNYTDVASDDSDLAERFNRFKLIETHSGNIVDILAKDLSQEAGGVAVTSEMRTQLREMVARWAADINTANPDIEDLSKSLTESVTFREKLEKARQTMEQSASKRLAIESAAKLPDRKWVRSYTDSERGAVDRHQALFGSIDNLSETKKEAINQATSLVEAEKSFEEAVGELKDRRADLTARYDFLERMRETAKQAVVAELRARFGVRDLAEIDLAQANTMTTENLKVAYKYVEKIAEQMGETTMLDENELDLSIKQLKELVEEVLRDKVATDFGTKLDSSSTYKSFGGAIRTMLKTPEIRKIWADPESKVRDVLNSFVNDTNRSVGVRQIAQQYLKLIN